MPRYRTKLSPRETRFVLAYLQCLSAAQAARESGYSEHTAKEQGCRLLTSVHVARAIAKVQDKALARAEASVERIIAEYVALAFFDPATMFSPDGEFLNIHDMPQAARRCIAGIEVEELFDGRGEDRRQIGTLKKIRFLPKTDALKALGTHLKMFVERESDRPNVTVNVLVSDEDANRVMQRLTQRLVTTNGNGNGRNGNGNH